MEDQNHKKSNQIILIISPSLPNQAYYFPSFPNKSNNLFNIITPSALSPSSFLLCSIFPFSFLISDIIVYI